MPEPLTDVLSIAQPATKICPPTLEPAVGTSVFSRSGPLTTMFGADDLAAGGACWALVGSHNSVIKTDTAPRDETTRLVESFI
jgi:hypothetical protein